MSWTIRQPPRWSLKNYVAEHRSLPPASAAPEIEFTALNGEKKMKLSDLRGKVVVLDFGPPGAAPARSRWRTCKNCVKPIQPGAKRPALVPLSIDDTLAIVREHVNKRGWTNTFNVWAGDGGWRSAPAQAFRVSAVPTTYIIDTQGGIVQAGHPAAMSIDEKVDALLHSTKE